MSRLSAKSKKIIANSLLAKISNDIENPFMQPEDWLAGVHDICVIAKQLGIASMDLADAYFKQPFLADNSKLKDEFDRSLQKTLGDNYAIEFIENLSRYEKSFIDDHKSKTVD